MSSRVGYFTSNQQFRLTLLFLLLGAGLISLVVGYWFVSLEPRLLADARASANALAQSHSRNLAEAVAEAVAQDDPTPLKDAVDEILVLTEPNTELPFVMKVAVKVDYSRVDVAEGSIDLDRGTPCTHCFVTRIPIYSPDRTALLAVATFHSSNAFFEQIRDAVRSRLLLVATGALALWLLVWRGVSSLFSAMRESEKAAAYARAQERGAAVERERIARDLHDDVAPQLLTLSYAAESAENEERARVAMRTLRESIYMLSEPRDVALEVVLGEWRLEALEHAEAADFRLSWQQPTELPDTLLTSRQRLNLGRILREAISNASRHARPSEVEIAIRLSGGRFIVHLAHDGQIADPETWQAGKGLANMRNRISELGGSIEWWLLQPPEGRLIVEWGIPVDGIQRSAGSSESPEQANSDRR